MDSVQFQSVKQDSKEIEDNNKYDLGNDTVETNIYLNSDKNGLYGIATFSGKDCDLCLQSGFSDLNMYKICRYQKFQAFIDTNYKYAALIKTSSRFNSFCGYYEDKGHETYFNYLNRDNNKLQNQKFVDAKNKLLMAIVVEEKKEPDMMTSLNDLDSHRKKSNAFHDKKKIMTQKNIETSANAIICADEKNITSALLPNTRKF